MKILHKNKQANFDYDIKDTYVVGLKLLGPEVKSIKNGWISLKGAYLTIKDGELFLKNAHIKRYQENNPFSNIPKDRLIKVLMRSDEIAYINRLKKTEKITLVPLKIILDGKRIVMEVGVGKRKRKYDKREDIRRRDMKIDAERSAKLK